MFAVLKVAIQIFAADENPPPYKIWLQINGYVVEKMFKTKKKKKKRTVNGQRNLFQCPPPRNFFFV